MMRRRRAEAPTFLDPDCVIVPPHVIEQKRAERDERKARAEAMADTNNTKEFNS